MPVVLTKGLNHKCCDCGIAIRNQEIAFEIIGSYIDYIERTPGEFNPSLLFCSGCRERILQHMKDEDQGDAILKRKELEAGGPAEDPVRIPSITADEFLSDNEFGIDMPDGTGQGI